MHHYAKQVFFFWIYQFFGTDLAFKRIDNIFTALLFLFFFSCWYGLQNTWTKHLGFNNSTKKCKPLLPCVEMQKETSRTNAGFITIPKCCSCLTYFVFWGKITNSLLTITYSNRTLQSNIFFWKAISQAQRIPVTVLWLLNIPSLKWSWKTWKGGISWKINKESEPRRQRLWKPLGSIRYWDRREIIWVVRNNIGKLQLLRFMFYHSPPCLQGPYCSSNAQTLFPEQSSHRCSQTLPRPSVWGSTCVQVCILTYPICCYKGPSFVPTPTPFRSF